MHENFYALHILPYLSLLPHMTSLQNICQCSLYCWFWKSLLSYEIDVIATFFQILALALEGRSRKGTRRRPNTSAYRKLDSNLEEAVTSTCSTSVTHVIY